MQHHKFKAVTSAGQDGAELIRNCWHAIAATRNKTIRFQIREFLCAVINM
jgi:hypothetical protein